MPGSGLGLRLWFGAHRSGGARSRIKGLGFTGVPGLDLGFRVQSVGLTRVARPALPEARAAPEGGPAERAFNVRGRSARTSLQCQRAVRENEPVSQREPSIAALFVGLSHCEM